MRFPTLFLLFCFFSCRCLAQTTDSIRILIIYGSKPAKGYPNERKWFGGKPGGHVSIQFGPDKVLSFRATKFHPMCHIFPRRKPRNFRSIFEIKTVRGAWNTFSHGNPNYNIDHLQRLVFAIPITKEQQKKIDSIASADCRQSPYDYAVLGMRCASSTYEIMAQLGLFKKPWKHAIWWHLLFPRDIRYELEKEYGQQTTNQTWRRYFYKGDSSRIWDHDIPLHLPQSN